MDDGRTARLSPRVGLGRIAFALTLAIATCLAFAVSASAHSLEISGSMEGAIKIHNGDFVAAGYIFNVKGGHPEEHVLFDEARSRSRANAAMGAKTRL